MLSCHISLFRIVDEVWAYRQIISANLRRLFGFFTARVLSCRLGWERGKAVGVCRSEYEVLWRMKFAVVPRGVVYAVKSGWRGG